MFNHRRKTCAGLLKFMMICGEELGENLVRTRNVPSPLLILAKSFRNKPSVFACSAVESGATGRLKGLNADLLRNWPSRHSVVAL